jgi:dipeptidyl aminopeptidase/acylaminoacyl peptidase
MRHVLARAFTGAAVVTAAFAAPAAAQQPLTIDDVFQLRSVGSAAISPDGDHVAFTVNVPRDITSGQENGARDTHLWLYRINGEARPFVTGDISVGEVAWRPGHGTITFRARRDGDDATVLYEIDPAGGEARRLYAHDESIGDYVWGPQGETLYFVAREDQPSNAFRSRGFTAYAYEEDQVFSHVWRVNLADGEAGEATAYELEGHASDIEISADGAHLAVALAPTPLIDDRYMARRWSVVSAADGSVISTVETEGKTGGVAFSPDGAHLAMIIGSDQNDPTAGTLAIADVETGDFTLIDVDAEQHIRDMAWGGEDSVLALAHVSVGSALVTYSITGEEEARQRWDSPVIHSIDRHPRSGELAVIYDSPNQPRTLATMTGPTARMNRPDSLDLNPWLDDRQLGEQRAYSFTASDGVRVDGVLITPRGRAPDGGWPLIMTVHGGPEAHDSNGWLTSYSDPGHIAAGQGYAVFYPNYRGSTGRGQAFARQHQNDYAGREFDDLVDAIAALAEDGIVDPDRVGITGGSYGGYASMWGATALSEHFAASVAFVGISNQISKFNTTDIPNEAYLVHSLEWPWEDWTNLLERSPVYYAGQSRTPTLILHGEEDTRVHPSQSLEMYRSLKLRSQAPVRLIYYPGEGHGNRMAAAQFDYAHRMMRWFDHYLMGEGGEPPAVDLDLETLLGEDAAD